MRAKEAAVAQIALNIAAEAAEKRATVVTAEDLSWFRERDRQRAEEKLAKKKAEEREQVDREERLARIRAKVQVNVQRDPSRLTQSTDATRNRMKDKSSTSGKPLYYEHFPHVLLRAFPSRHITSISLTSYYEHFSHVILQVSLTSYYKHFPHVILRIMHYLRTLPVFSVPPYFHTVCLSIVPVISINLALTFI